MPDTCDVCMRGAPDHVPIGVASTSIPFSCAFCRECAQRGADPLLVFEHWFDVIGSPDQHRFPDDAVSFYDGHYISYRDWYAIRDRQQDGHVTLYYEQRQNEEG